MAMIGDDKRRSVTQEDNKKLAGLPKSTDQFFNKIYGLWNAIQLKCCVKSIDNLSLTPGMSNGAGPTNDWFLNAFSYGP